LFDYFQIFNQFFKKLRKGAKQTKKNLFDHFEQGNLIALVIVAMMLKA
jgi:hypothetical protein